ncbi:hypothetical protein ACFVAJ_17235 [Agromyces sp. NPDC057679]|uniref:hypothetical protein n=1 Tax=Agromyces sp. NPDC057679 TaxID=3346207 RepID=UPI00366CAC7C
MVTIKCDKRQCGRISDAGVADTAGRARARLAGAGWRLNVPCSDGIRRDYCPDHSGGPKPETAEGARNDQLIGVLALHQWHIARWGDGSGGFCWRCSCGVMDWGTGAENPERYERYETNADAAAAAVRHIAAAIAATDGQANDG